MRELFIYYRSTVADADELGRRAARAQAELRARHPGLRARLLRRPELDRNGLHTWMETYAMDPTHADGVTDELARAIEDAALVFAPLLAGPRHIERFDACAS